jgi:uncharacterized delta-60 repeat protein
MRVRHLLCGAAFAGLISAGSPAGPAWAAGGGTLDPAFGTGGVVLTDITGAGATEYAYAMAVQADGRIVTAGFSSPSSHGSTRDFAVARYNRDGTLDTSFGTGGSVVTDVGATTVDEARAVVVQPDGAIVVAGFSYTTANTDFALVRYLRDGTLDPSFGAGGKVVTDVSGGSGDGVQGLALQPDGRIVAAGYGGVGFSLDFAVARYNRDGSLDRGFGDGGRVLTDLRGLDRPDRAAAVAVLPNGRIVVGGTSEGAGPRGPNSDFAVARYKRDGTLDASFGTGGTVVTDFSGQSSYEVAAAMAIQPNGKVVLAGGSYASGSYDFALARYNRDGTPDTSFGTGGTVLTDFAGRGLLDFPNAVAVQRGGKIVAVGNSTAAGTFDLALARYNRDGTLDPGFGTGGTALTDVTGAARNDQAFAAAIHPSGRLLVAGYSDARGNSDFALARYRL